MKTEKFPAKATVFLNQRSQQIPGEENPNFLITLTVSSPVN
jgi:hypothetical protein